jgi:hypothetical protein
VAANIEQYSKDVLVEMSASLNQLVPRTVGSFVTGIEVAQKGDRNLVFRTRKLDDPTNPNEDVVMVSFDLVMIVVN